MGEGNGLFVISKKNGSVNVLVLFYRQLPMGGKETSIEVKFQKLPVGWHLLNYENMFVETPIYIRSVVITIVLFTSMLAIELFYLTLFVSFLGYFFEYLLIFIPYRFALYH